MTVPWVVKLASMGNLSQLLKESWSLVEIQDRLAGHFYCLFLSNRTTRSSRSPWMQRRLPVPPSPPQTIDDLERFDSHLRSPAGPRQFHVERSPELWRAC